MSKFEIAIYYIFLAASFLTISALRFQNPDMTGTQLWKEYWPIYVLIIIFAFIVGARLKSKSG